MKDDGLRLLAIERLGPLAPAVAREALEMGTTDVKPNVLAWQGSLGMVHGHEVVLWIHRDLCTRVLEVPSVVDVLTAAIASAIGSVSGNALAELKILRREMAPARSTAYRGRQ